MGLERLLLASIVAMWISPCILLPLASSEEIFPEAEGPAAESSDELWLRSGPPPRVVDDNDYGARANGCDDTEVKLRAALPLSLNLSLLRDLLGGACRQEAGCSGCSNRCCKRFRRFLRRGGSTGGSSGWSGYTVAYPKPALLFLMSFLIGINKI